MSSPDMAASAGLPPHAGGSAVTVGMFDGVHRGHWTVLQRLREVALQRDLMSVLVTFDPHPLKILRPEAAPSLLTTPNEKKEILSLSGIDYAAFLRFTRSLSLYEPEEFVREVLLRRLGLRYLVVGYDHGFGRGRSGDPETLRAIGARHGFEVEVVERVAMEAAQGGQGAEGEEVEEGEPISSTCIRQALARGAVERAERGLGRPYSMTGIVVHGEGRGRSLGFPTANLKIDGRDKLLPRQGIYAVRAAARTHLGSGLLHLGPRPTFQGSPPSIELHLLDFDEELYGDLVRVEFLARLRDIQPFASAAELVEQMKRDRAAAEEFFGRR